MEYFVVGIDGSEGADKAFNVAVKEAKLHNKGLLIVHVVPMAQCYTARGFSVCNLEIPKDTLDKVTPLMNNYVKRAKEGGVDAKGEILGATNVGATLIKKAEEVKSKLIIIGSKGLTGLSRYFLGSVAEFVVQNSTCNVCVVKCE